MRGLGGERVRARLPDLERGLVQIGGVATHHARERLAVGEAAVGLHQRVGVARGHLAMIAEDVVVADLERGDARPCAIIRSEGHTSELQSLMRISYAVFCLQKKTDNINGCTPP